MDTEALGKSAGALVSGLSDPQHYQETKKDGKERKEKKFLKKFHDDLHAFAMGGAASKRFMSTYAMAQIHEPELAQGLRAKARHIRTQFGESPEVPHLKETDQGVPKEYQGPGVQYDQRGRETAEAYQGDPLAAPAPGAVPDGPPVDMNTVLGTMDKQSYDEAVRFACEFNNSAARNGKAPMTWEEAVQLRAQGKTRFDLGFDSGRGARFGRFWRFLQFRPNLMEIARFYGFWKFFRFE
jgi:hypothetical protein